MSKKFESSRALVGMMYTGRFKKLLSNKDDERLSEKSSGHCQMLLNALFTAYNLSILKAFYCYI